MEEDYQFFHLEWKVSNNRINKRLYKTYIVQPSCPEIDKNEELFFKTINFLFKGNGQIEPENFDFILFPECFLPSNCLIKLFDNFPFGEIGCIHTGLRPESLSNNHLFNKEEINNLISDISKHTHVNSSDLIELQKLVDKIKDEKINLAAFITKDSEDKIRICIHPKIVRARAEYFMLDEETMLESNIIYTITLKSENRRQINIQPFICADIIDSPNDSFLPHPLEALAEKYMDELYIDIISIPTCTPIHKSNNPNVGYDNFTWKKEFKDIFYLASSGLGFRSKLSNTCFLLSNYSIYLDKLEYGLSGVYFPSRFNDIEPEKVPEKIQVEIFAHPEKDLRNYLDEFGLFQDQGWVHLRHLKNKKKFSQKELGKISGKLILEKEESTFDPNSGKYSNSIMISFNLCLPKNTQNWKPQELLSKIKIYHCEYEEINWKEENISENK